MRNEMFVGGVIGSVGRESFSAVSRSILGNFADNYVYSILPITSLAIYEDGRVLEVLHLRSIAGAHYCIQVLDGRVIDVRCRASLGKAWEDSDFYVLNMWANANAERPLEYDDHCSFLRWIDSVENEFASLEG